MRVRGKRAHGAELDRVHHGKLRVRVLTSVCVKGFVVAAVGTVVTVHLQPTSGEW